MDSYCSFMRNYSVFGTVFLMECNLFGQNTLHGRGTDDTDDTDFFKGVGDENSC